MTLICAPILAQDRASALADAERARLAGADLVEFRVDAMFQGLDDADDVLHAVRESPLSCIVTCRAEREGGLYEGDDEDRAALFERLIASDAPPRYIDVEWSTLERDPSIAERIERALAGAETPDATPDTTKIIVSLHDFDRRPKDLLRRLRAMQASPLAHVIKVAYIARSVRDNLELFDLLAERDRPTIALAMGETGLMSRVLAPKFGGFLTFASLRNESATAPGQPTVSDLLSTYRFNSIGRDTQVFGVVGWPVTHSLSPAAHNAAFEAAGADAVYLPLPVPPEPEHLKASLHALCAHERLGFAGASVTIPHKQNLARFAREHADEGWRLSDAASAIGAANTIARDADGWLADNTDAEAVRACAQDALGDLDGLRALVLGAGGAARAAAWALSTAGARVTIANRTPERGATLAEEIDQGIEVTTLDDAPIAGARLVVNATPVGMAGGPDPDGAPISLERAPEGCVVFDTVYNPLETPLLRAARDRGLPTVDGAAMFVRQALAQSRLWTGRDAPANLIDRVVRERLES